jgi:hypothetical protein
LPYLRDTLLVLSAEKDGPGNATGVLALKEEGLSLSVLESENLAVTTDVELSLQAKQSAFNPQISLNALSPIHLSLLPSSPNPRSPSSIIAVPRLVRVRGFVPFLGRSSRPRRYRRRYAYWLFA